jgi:hypothetical protein
MAYLADEWILGRYHMQGERDCSLTRILLAGAVACSTGAQHRRSSMKEVKQKLTLDRHVVYEIKVPGELDERWTDWDGKMTVTVESEGEGQPVSTLTGLVDQAALHGVLRRLYSLGLPLLSVICVECG